MGLESRRRRWGRGRGEVPAAYVELVPGETATEEELIAFCKGQIASFKIPRHVRFLTAAEWQIGRASCRERVL